jgi:hypothetical protein
MVGICSVYQRKKGISPNNFAEFSQKRADLLYEHSLLSRSFRGLQIAKAIRLSNELKLFRALEYWEGHLLHNILSKWKEFTRLRKIQPITHSAQVSFDIFKA